MYRLGLPADNMRTNRFQGFTTPIRTSSLRRLKRALSPHSAHTVTSSTSSASTDTTSPLSQPVSSNSSHEDLESLSPLSSLSSGGSPSSTISSSSKINQALRVRAMRRRPSILAREMMEERVSFAAEIGVMEPRPQPPLAVGGIFEVLEGRV